MRLHIRARLLTSMWLYSTKRREAFTYAMHGNLLAIGLLNRGIPREKIIVPSYSYNIMLIQFGATIVLVPSFPVFWTISKVFDMPDASHRRLAAAYARKANSWTEKLVLFNVSLPIEAVTDMKLDESACRIKIITNSLAKRGFGSVVAGEGGT